MMKIQRGRRSPLAWWPGRATGGGSRSPVQPVGSRKEENIMAENGAHCQVEAGQRLNNHISVCLCSNAH